MKQQLAAATGYSQGNQFLVEVRANMSGSKVWFAIYRRFLAELVQYWGRELKEGRAFGQ